MTASQQQFRRIHVGVSAQLAIMIGFSAVSLAMQQYSIQTINDISAYAINNSSQITGFIPGSPANAALWSSGSAVPIQLPGTSESIGTAINNAGEIVGSSINDDQTVETGFAWTPTSGLITPFIPPGQSEFFAVNNLGQIGGAYLVAGSAGPSVAAIWTGQGNITALPSLPGADDNSVQSLNDVGQAVGSSGISGIDGWPGNANAPYADNHAVLWQKGSVIDLTPNNPWSDAYAINNEGQTVGFLIDVVDNDFVFVPFIWDSIHGLVELPHYGLNSLASDINDAGQVVGSTTDPNDPTNSIAALWEHGVLYDLNDLLPNGSGWDLQGASGINELGQIVGYGTYDGQPEGFLLTPIPEPTAISLAAEFYFLANRRRQRRH